MGNPMILVGNRILTNKRFTDSNQPCEQPRLDYLEFGKRLNGKLYGYDVSDAAWYRFVRSVESKLKIDFLEAILAHQRMNRHNIVLSTSEKIAIPLAALAQMDNRATPHVVIAHKLSSGRKVPFFETWKLYRSFTHLICVSKSQVEYGIRNLRIPKDKIDFVYDKVDQDFFRPQDDGLGNYVLAVGLEQRDYKTLLDAIPGSNLDLKIVASSRWSHQHLNHHQLGEAEVYHDLPYSTLRALYAGARLVVLPLFNVDYAAGVNTLLEAMAMGKTTVISRSKGIIDYVTNGETGLYVAPGDSEQLRETVLDAWHSPGSLKQIGRNARLFVEDTANINNYVEKICSIVQKCIDG
jgi:glycosyltransferase involved in cell wall biosynthesis